MPPFLLSSRVAADILPYHPFLPFVRVGCGGGGDGGGGGGRVRFVDECAVSQERQTERQTSGKKKRKKRGEGD